MKYEWEDSAAKQIPTMEDCLPQKRGNGFAIMGVAIQNTDTGEAAFIVNDDLSNLDPVTDLDCWNDAHADMGRAMADAQVAYEKYFSENTKQ